MGALPSTAIRVYVRHPTEWNLPSSAAYGQRDTVSSARPNLTDVGDPASVGAQLSRVGGRERGWRARNEPAIARNLPSQEQTFAAGRNGHIPADCDPQRRQGPIESSLSKHGAPIGAGAHRAHVRSASKISW